MITDKYSLTIHIVFHCFIIVKCTDSSQFITDVDIIVIGGTGDLARKYLWQGIFQTYQSELHRIRFSFVGSGRRDISQGEKILQDILHNNLNCTDELSCWQKQEFILKTSYFQLKTDAHFEQLCDNLNMKFQFDKSKLERNKKSFQMRLFYLAIPPFDYETVLKNISRHCRPDIFESILRIALEKPFGNNTSTAVNLSNLLKKHFSQQEIYVIDHYLWKTGVKQIAQFRFENKEKLELLWRTSSIEKIQIVMKEKDDLKGRMNYFKDYGIIGDVMQNHMMEILFLIANNVSEEFAEGFMQSSDKLNLINSVTPVDMNEVLGGQYDNYMHQIKKEIDTHENFFSIPTYAAIVLYINSSRWNSVPFHFIAGKAMDENALYIRVVFKNIFSFPKIQNCDSFHCSKTEILFIVKHPLFKKPSVLVHRNLQQFISSCDTNKLLKKDLLNVNNSLGISFKEYDICLCTESSNPYRYIFLSLLNSKFNFLNNEYIIKLWNLWDPVISYLHNNSLLHIYKNNNVNELEYIHVNKTTYFICI